MLVAFWRQKRQGKQGMQKLSLADVCCSIALADDSDEAEAVAAVAL